LEGTDCETGAARVPFRTSVQGKPMRFTERDKNIVRALVKKVRMMTAGQIAQAWWPQAEASAVLAARRLRLLKTHRLINRVTLPAHPMLDLAAPVITWRPGQPDPDYYAVSYQLTSRWPSEYVPTDIYVAADSGARMFGLSAAQPVRHPDQATHDLHLSAVYLTMLRERPEVAQAWIGEEEFAPERERQKLPDAVVKDAAGNVRMVIEFGGKYDPVHFRAFHEDCRKRQTPYQVW